MKKILFLIFTLMMSINLTFSQNGDALISRFVNDISNSSAFIKRDDMLCLEKYSKHSLLFAEKHKKWIKRVSIVKISDVESIIINITKAPLGLPETKEILNRIEKFQKEFSVNIYAVNYKAVDWTYAMKFYEDYIEEIVVNGNYTTKLCSGEFSNGADITVFIYDSLRPKENPSYSLAGDSCLSLFLPMIIHRETNYYKDFPDDIFFHPIILCEKIVQKVDSVKELPKKEIANSASFIIPNDFATIELWDFEQIDKDVVDVYLNGILQESSFQLSSKKLILNVALSNKASEIIIKVVSEGSLPPCTVRARVKEINKEFTLQGKKDEFMKISLNKN